MKDGFFIHKFVPGAEPCLLLLHGTGGDESDLLPLGRALSMKSALLSPRGQVLENGMPRFFRRIAEGVFDQEDLIRRTAELGDWVAAQKRKLGYRHILAVGYSNGANIAASLLLTRPEVLFGAILFRPMVPFESEYPPKLSARPILICAGRKDTIIPPASSERLARILEGAGALVTLHWEPTGHTLNDSEISVAREWLRKVR